MMNSLWSFLRALALVHAVVFMCTASAWAQAGDPTMSPVSIHAVRYHVEPGRTRVWFETSGTVLYTQYSPDPLTLVIDLPGVEVSGIAERTVVGSREVESILVARLDGATGKSLSRIEIKLSSLVPYQISASEHALSVLFESGDAVEDTASREEPEVEPAPPEAPEELIESGAPTDRPAEREAPAEVVKTESNRNAVAAEPPAVEPPATDVSSYPPASFVQSVLHTVSEGILKVTVEADGRLNYSSFRLENPKRLVFDFNGVTNQVRRTNVPVDFLGVSRIRIAQFRSASPRITRIVFDLEGDVPHRAVERDRALEILFAASVERLAEAVPDPTPVGTTDDMISLAPPEDRLGGNGEGRAYGPPEAAGSLPTPSLGLSEGVSIQPVAVVAQSPLAELPAEMGGSVPLLPSPPQETPPGQQILPPESFESQTIGTEESVYTGELISLDFKDGDIQDIFRLFAEISGLNIVVQPGVSGRITLKLTEVPWDQALDLILKTHKLGYVVEGNVVRIAPLSELANEEAERRRLAEEKALAGELSTMTRQLSYAKADGIQPLLRRNLSPRGEIEIDARTNTIIVTDLADRLQNINTLIDTLDTPIPGVEIEARVVVTTRSFSRQFGIQWGFAGHMDEFFGNTTELTFPNRILLDGQSIGSDVVEEFKTPGPVQGGGSGGLSSPQIGADEAQRGYAVNLPLPASPTGAIGISLGSISGAFGIDAALSAAERHGQARILSAPKIITQNNKAATIKQGITFPVQTVANNTVTVTFKDAVLELTVTPQITSANTIILDINVNNDEADFSRTVNGIPSILTQEANTQVLVADGSTTVVGGVFRNSVDQQQQYVPLLHRIPILGYLFRNDSKTEENRELLIFITPRIRKEVPVVVGGQG